MEYVHEKTKHVNTLNLLLYLNNTRKTGIYNTSNLHVMCFRPQVKGFVAPLNGQQHQSILMRKALRCVPTRRTLKRPQRERPSVPSKHSLKRKCLGSGQCPATLFKYGQNLLMTSEQKTFIKCLIYMHVHILSTVCTVVKINYLQSESCLVLISIQAGVVLFDYI